jgi:hypothetical protein
MACRAAVKAPKRRTWGGKTGGPRGTARSGDATARGGTPPHHSVAPTSMPAACGLSVCSQAAVAGSGCDDAVLRRGMTSSRMHEGNTGAAGGGVAGRGRLPNGIDAGRRHQAVSSPTTRPQTPRSSLPNGPKAPPRGRIPRPAARRKDSTAAPLFPAVGAPRQGITRFPRHYPRCRWEGWRGRRES